jgi:hypothetical protein
MRTIQLLLATATASFALSNSVTLTNLSGGQATRALTIPRYFADKEICHYPQPYAEGTAARYWQADVRNRWPADADCAGGYVKFALITIEQTMIGSGSVTVDFRDSEASSSGGAGLDKAGMLNFDGGSGAGVWPSRGSYTEGGITFNTSAKTMISNDHYKILENGPLRTSVLVREGPEAISGATTRTTSFGWQCTTNCAAPYDQAVWVNHAAYYSIRPSYVVTFYRLPGQGTGRVETDFLLDNGWMDRAQDQRISSTVLYKDDTGGSACYTAPAVFVIPFRSRMFETCWSADPPAVHIDLNFKYLYYSKVIPAYGPEYTVSAAAENLELNDTLYGFLSKSDQGATVTAASSPHMGKGQWQFYGMQGSVGGSSPGVAVIPRWDVRWLARQSPGLLAAVLGNAKASFHAPVFYADSSTTGVFRRGQTDKAFGRAASIDSRPTFISSSAIGTEPADSVRSPHADIVSANCAAPNCMVTIPYANYGWYSVMTFGNSPTNAWGHDVAHRTGNYLAAYLATGKYAYLEGMYHEASFIIAFGPPGTIPDAKQTYAHRWTGVYYELGNSPRSSAWGFRTMTWAATFAPDGSVEQGYYQDRLKATLEMTRGRLNIGANGRSCAGFNRLTETDPWKMGRCYYEGNSTSNTLHEFMTITQGLYDIPCYCSTSPQAGGLYSNWQHQYVMVSLNHLLDLGWDVKPVLEFVADYDLHLIADTALKSPLFSRLYWLPGFQGSTFDYVQSWTDVYNGKAQTAILAKPMGRNDRSVTVLGTLDTQGNPQENVMDVSIAGGIWMRADGEIFKAGTFSALPAKAVTAVDTIADTITIASHEYATGETAMFQNGALDNGMTGGPTCSTDRNGNRVKNCWFYVKALDTNTLELYRDAGLTQKVDLTGGSAGMASARSIATIHAVCGRGTGADYCRGQFDTAAADHPAGAVAERLPISAYYSRDPDGDADGAHGVYYSSGLSAAVDIDATAIDSLTGETITAARAYEQLWGSMRWKDRFGGRANCTGVNLSTCDNPVWGIRPRHRIRDIAVTTGESSQMLNYTAPTGDGCRVGISSTPFPTSSDSGDTDDQQVILPRSFPLNGLPAGKHYYRITCGPGGGTARAAGRFTAAAQ